MKACIIIPSYNEAKAIGGLVREIRSQNFDTVIVDDGSQDNTSVIAQNYGAIVLRNQKNQGKGASLIRGFDYALGNGFDAVITMDGDGQHEPSDIPNFLRSAENSRNAIFIGNRMMKTKGMPWLRIATNKFMSWLISCATKQKIPDTQCGFRLIKRGLLEKLKLTALKYEIESEMLIKAARLGFTIESIPIKTVYRQEKSQINPFIDTLRFIRFILRELRELWTTPS